MPVHTVHIEQPTAELFDSSLLQFSSSFRRSLIVGVARVLVFIYRERSWKIIRVDGISSNFSGIDANARIGCYLFGKLCFAMGLYTTNVIRRIQSFVKICYIGLLRVIYAVLSNDREREREFKYIRARDKWR